MTSNFANAMTSKDSRTDNGAITNSTSSDFCLDMFFLAGASRNISEQDIINTWVKAYNEDKELATLVLLWSRDARDGAGERRFFNIIIKHIIEYRNNYKEVITLDLVRDVIPKLGYWKDYFNVFQPTDENVKYLTNFIETDNLLAKWFPRKGLWFSKTHRILNMTPKDFRKLLVSKSSTVEQQMCSNDWESIEFGKVPSIAHNKYKKSFAKRQYERYNDYLSNVSSGDEKINSSVIYPYQLIYGISMNNKTSIAQWENLPNFMTEDSKILPVVDVSGSMDTTLGKTKYTCMDVSISLGLYLSERNEGHFKDMFITFSSVPELQLLKGNVYQRFHQLRSANWSMRTNIQLVFQTILDRAKNNNLTNEDLPDTILIISDMEFDNSYIKGKERTAYEAVAKMYKKSGYNLPNLVFWNVNGRVGNVPVKADTPNTSLVSGFSPSIMTSILSNTISNPHDIMVNTVSKYKSYLI